MKSIWLKLKEICVDSASCPRNEENETKFDIKSVRSIVSREVDENVGKVYNSYSNKSHEQTLIFQCNWKNCPVKWRAKVSPKDQCLVAVQLERNDTEHHHVIEKEGRLPREVAQYVSDNKELPSMFLLKKVRKSQTCLNLNNKKLKSKISNAKWYYTRKEKK